MHNGSLAARSAGLRAYLMNLMDLLDGVVVLSSLFEIGVEIVTGDGGANALAALRALRLLRVLKVMSRIKSLQILSQVPALALPGISAHAAIDACLLSARPPARHAPVLLSVLPPSAVVPCPPSQVVMDVIKNLSNMCGITLLVLIQIAILGLQLYGGKYSEAAQAALPIRYTNFYWAMVASFQVSCFLPPPPAPSRPFPSAGLLPKPPMVLIHALPHRPHPATSLVAMRARPTSHTYARTHAHTRAHHLNPPTCAPSTSRWMAGPMP